MLLSEPVNRRHPWQGPLRGLARAIRASSLGMREGTAQLPARRSALSVLLAAGAAGGLLACGGCGFHLRGNLELPFNTLYTTFAPTSPMGAEFRRSLRNTAGTRVVDKPEEAQARLLALSELREKEIIAFSSTGRPREYELRLRFRFQLLDAQANEWIPLTELILRREVTTTDSEVASKAQEEVLLYRDMQSDMVQQVLRRLAAAPRRS